MSLLTIKLVDVYGNPLTRRAKVALRKDNDIYRFDITEGQIDISGLSHDLAEIYSLQVRARSYHTVAQFVVVSSKTQQISVVLPVKDSAVKSVTFPDLPTEFNRLSGIDCYQNLSDLPKAGLLNILTKCKATQLDGCNVSDLILGIRDVKQDRILAAVGVSLLWLVEASKDFHKVSGSLHDAPFGFMPAGSFKTSDSYGNLQITFFQRCGEFLADIDIDDANGLRHAFQVIRNTVKGPTHPYNIHQILVGYQGINPGYILNV